MTKFLKKIEKILGVIALKRQRLEADMAVLKRKDAALLEQFKTMSELLEQAPNDNDEALTFALIASKWAIWREKKKLAIQKERIDLSILIDEISQDLKRLSVQISALETKRLAAQKQDKIHRENQRAETRLETWINAQ